MTQEKVMALLQEAVKADVTRQTQIQVELNKALISDEVDQHPGLELVLAGLFVQTLQNRPAFLPNLFPVFAFLCGDRDEDVVCADINWSLLS